MTLGFRHACRVHFSDTDLAGVAHFTLVPRAVENAWHAWLAAAGLAAHPAHAPDAAHALGWPVVALAVSYLGPARFGDELVVDLHLACAGERSLTLAFTVGRDARSLAEGQMKVACTLPVDGGLAACPVPSEILPALAAVTRQL
jgi:acyl-CoA thioester hydrolase